MITAENLKKNFGTTSVINDISLEINQGEFIGIMGESGSGKSTLLYLLSGLLTPTSGKVFVKKDEITSMNDTRLSNFRTSNFGFIFQF
ncbi:MAG TPA: ATP-binding cassette domain-containing protein, partial [Clostridiaceae bacterium]|nr:ATP-binding cassette domain-containing protein [Clostridiaceae bacterium]